MTEDEYVKSIIDSLYDDLVRAQYDLAIWTTARTESAEINPTIEKKLHSAERFAGNCIGVFNHIDLIIQQDSVQTICRMLDKSKNVKSFYALAKKAKFLDNTPNIEKFIKLEAKLRKSDNFKKLKHLRDEVLAHRSKNPRSSTAHIKMVIDCLEKLEELLSLSYLIFLKTSFRTRSGYDFATKHAQNYWELTFDVNFQTNPSSVIIPEAEI